MRNSYTKKHTELAALDKSLMKTRVKELEGIITGNEKVISLIENQVSNIHQNSLHSTSSSPHTINTHLHTLQPSLSLATTVEASLQADTPISSNLNDTTVDQNFNTKYSLTKSQASSLDTATSYSLFSFQNILEVSPSHHSPSQNTRNKLRYCQNCQNELPEDYDIELPPPIYFYDFIAECPSPWLHYGYCTPCLVVARFANHTLSRNFRPMS